MLNKNNERIVYVLIGKKWGTGDATARIREIPEGDLKSCEPLERLHSETIDYGMARGFSYDGKVWFSRHDKKTGELIDQISEEHSGPYREEWNAHNETPDVNAAERIEYLEGLAKEREGRRRGNDSR